MRKTVEHTHSVLHLHAGVRVASALFAASVMSEARKDLRNDVLKGFHGASKAVVVREDYNARV